MSSEKTIYMEKQRSETPAMRKFLLATAALVLCFGVPLYRLGRFAIGNDLYSYILLMPFVTWYLMRQQKPVTEDSKPMTGLGLVFLLAGAATMGAYFAFVRPTADLKIEDYLSINMFSFYLLLMGLAATILGGKTFRASSFPLGMLIFLTPLPNTVMDHIVLFLQYGSAITAAAFFKVFLCTYKRTGLIFALPDTPGLEVAPECSGIHSSWILLITSLLAGYLFLRSPRNRAILTLAVIPLALLRNGFRIFTIGELCVHISPDMIDSYIHRKGGPIFFGLSLIPFFLLLFWLRKRERGLRQKPLVQA
jgi:exosortase C (VPDSG-CTERM-specific)